MHSRSVLPLPPCPTWTYQSPLQLEDGSLSRRSLDKAELLPCLSPSTDTSSSRSKWICTALVLSLHPLLKETSLSSTHLNTLSSFWAFVS